VVVVDYDHAAAVGKENDNNAMIDSFIVLLPRHAAASMLLFFWLSLKDSA